MTKETTSKKELSELSDFIKKLPKNSGIMLGKVKGTYMAHEFDYVEFAYNMDVMMCKDGFYLKGKGYKTLNGKKLYIADDMVDHFDSIYSMEHFDSLVQFSNGSGDTFTLKKVMKQNWDNIIDRIKVIEKEFGKDIWKKEGTFKC